MAAGERPAGAQRVRKLQGTLHAKAREDPGRRFHALIDKVWHEDFLLEAWKRVRRKGGSAGVDGETTADIEEAGVERWIGDLSREPGKFRPQGTPCLRDRVAQTPAMLVLVPIFEADLQPEQYACRPGRGANDAVKRLHHLLSHGHFEVVDCDLSSHFGEMPHAELMRSVARRVSDGRMLGLVRAWLEMPVEEDDGTGGKRRTSRARRERKGVPQGAPVSPLVSNIHMRRFILGWKALGRARRFGSEIVNYADDLCVLGRAPAADMLLAVRHLTDRLKLPVNERKTRCLRCPEEPFELLGYRIGWTCRRTDGTRHVGTRHVGTRPGRVSVQDICHRISEATDQKSVWMDVT